DILTEIRQHLCGVGKGPRLVLRDLQRLPCKVDGVATAGLGYFGPTIIDQPHLAERRQGERQLVPSIDRNRLLEETERLGNVLSRYWTESRKCAQAQIVSAKVSSRAVGRAHRLGGLQCRLDDPGDAHRDLVLEIKHVLQRAVEAIGPEMCTACRVDELGGDAN